ncbi:DUF6174 domain-containing protein [bacterium]|nr:DUF6174 domain-containing protein [bacterium]
MDLFRIPVLKINLYLYIGVVFVFLAGCEAHLQKATPGLIEEAEADWKKEAIPNYKIVVDVQMQGNMRRNEITVQNKNIRQATVSYKENGKWVRTKNLNQSQAMAFTVPGLFEAVQEELRVHARSDIRVAFNSNKSYIERIVLGPVLRTNEPVENSEVYIFVRKFEPSPSAQKQKSKLSDIR